MNKKAKWGFDWGKVGSGCIMLLAGAVGIWMRYMEILGTRLLAGSIVAALIGAYLVFDGLMGEDGIW